MEPFLDETTYYDPPNCTFPFGTHVCTVEIDPDTGKVNVLRYVAVDDVGKVINPLIVDGQIHGGIAQGLAQALYEGAVYDENGQLLTGSLMDYAIPKADMVPNYELDRTVTPSPTNPMGVKGAGEAGTIASAASSLQCGGRRTIASGHPSPRYAIHGRAGLAGYQSAQRRQIVCSPTNLSMRPQGRSTKRSRSCRPMTRQKCSPGAIRCCP